MSQLPGFVTSFAMLTVTVQYFNLEFVVNLNKLHFLNIKNISQQTQKKYFYKFKDSFLMTPRDKLKLAEPFIKAKINLQCQNVVTLAPGRK